MEEYNEVTFVTRVNLIEKIFFFIADFCYASKMLSSSLKDLLILLQLSALLSASGGKGNRCAEGSRLNIRRHLIPMCIL